MPSAPKMVVTEKRWREAKGQRYLRDGITIRCQCVSKANLRRIRIEQGNLELTSEDVWPEGQCPFAAEPGTFACNLHGGSRLSIEKRGSAVSLGMIPIDMREKIEILQQNPDYISREMQIWEVLAMNAQLYERMEELGGGPDSFEKILDGLAVIEGGRLADGIEGIRKIILSEKAQRELRDELRTNMTLLKELTKVQVSTAKELKTMATTDQVMNMVEGIVDDFISIVKDVISEKTIADRLVDRFIRAIRLRLNTKVATPVEVEVVDGSIDSE